MRAGLFGGTFNPIHNGHLMVAEKVVLHFKLDRLYIVPCRIPPHKPATQLAPSLDRLAMIQLALTENRHCRLSEVEIHRNGPSYTIDTVNHFRADIGPDAELFLVMGMDAFLDIHTWKRYLKLLKLIQPVVVARRMDRRLPNGDDVRRMDQYIRSRLPDDYQRDLKSFTWRRCDGNRIHLLMTAPVDVSSSCIRKRVKAGKPIKDLVPPGVNAYIEEKGLYR